MLPTPFYDYGLVGSGFADTYNTIYLWPPDPGRQVAAMAAPSGGTGRRAFGAQMADALHAHAAATSVPSSQPAPRLALAGHSLGSALVTLYAVERLVFPTIPIDKFYTFASPLVGDSTFQAAFDSLNLPVTNRIYDDWDPVPYLPPLPIYVPVGAPKEIDLHSDLYGWNPLCAHSMDTYLHCFDNSHPPAKACSRLWPLAAATMAAAPAPATTERMVVEHAALEHAAMTPASVAAAPAHATAVPAATVKKGSTTVTITIQTDGG